MVNSRGLSGHLTVHASPTLNAPSAQVLPVAGLTADSGQYSGQSRSRSHGCHSPPAPHAIEALLPSGLLGVGQGVAQTVPRATPSVCSHLYAPNVDIDKTTREHRQSKHAEGRARGERGGGGGGSRIAARGAGAGVEGGRVTGKAANRRQRSKSATCRIHSCKHKFQSSRSRTQHGPRT